MTTENPAASTVATLSPETASLRERMLAAAEEQLVASTDNEIATRAVCDAVGVTQPVLYRLFGDKRGLLDALADAGLERYAAIKGAEAETADPVADLRAGWDGHMEFARENQALYQLMFVPRPWSTSTARERILGLLDKTLTRCVAIGALTVSPQIAAQLILSANVGLVLNHIAKPELFADASLSHRMRDAVFASILVEQPDAASAAPMTEAGSPIGAAAARLRAQLALSGTETLEPVESALLDHWLERVVDAD
ncbi:TetR/AcrR family transcriptional regulator [Plantibacter sp. YIM 135347]|uniref:TetR/AcrR family transcriptional regulator n=1 Tax=Plantibacter sp. YIM 135347 TaxID=3423919 RepID=UPI003D32989F